MAITPPSRKLPPELEPPPFPSVGKTAPISSQMQTPRPLTPRRRHLASPLRPPPPPPRSHDAKRHRLESSDDNDDYNDDTARDAEDPCRDDRDAALNGRLRMSPTGSDVVITLPPWSLSPNLEPPSFSFACEASPPAWQTATRFPPASLEPSTAANLEHCRQVALLTADPSSGMRASLAALEVDSQAACLTHARQEQSDKSTAKTYKRHVDRYEKSWLGYQEGQAHAIPAWTAIPAFPITAVKASMFLGHESMREKVRSCIPRPIGAHPLNNMSEQKKTGSKLIIEHSNIGKESISQTVSALEHWRFNHAHFYRDDPDVQVPLRYDTWVQTIEMAKKHDEPKRVESAQALKATGCSSGQPFLSMHAGFFHRPDKFPLRHIHGGGTHAMFHLVPAALLGETAPLHWPA